MVKHIVMFKLKQEFEGKPALELAKEAQGQAEKLKDLVPSVEKMEVVCNAPAADGTNYELVEVTPESLRIRKRILDSTLRKRANINKI